MIPVGVIRLGLGDERDELVDAGRVPVVAAPAVPKGAESLTAAAAPRRPRARAAASWACASTPAAATSSAALCPGSAALDDVVRGRAAFAVLPFESSEDGLVQSTLNALAGTELVIVAERSEDAK